MPAFPVGGNFPRFSLPGNSETREKWGIPMMFKKSAFVVVPVAVAATATAIIASTAMASTPTPSVSAPTVSAVTSSSVTVHWTASGGAEAEVQVYQASTGQQAYRETLSADSVTITGLSAGTAYDVRANAFYGGKGHTWTASDLFFTTAAAGPSGVVSTGTHSLVSPSSPATASTGGSFTARATVEGTVTLSAGTYLLNVNAMVTPDATTNGDVFPQLMVYDGPVNADFTNDLFNVGNGAIENPTSTELTQGNLINGYLSASNEITVPADGETLDVYAFGYDSDQGEGSYQLNDLTVTATQLQVG